MTAAHKDYSGTPLWKKLGIRAGARVLLAGAPEGLDLGELPAEVEFVSRASAGMDVVVLFVTRAAGLTDRFARLAAQLEPDGRLWLAWPKKASGASSDIDFALAQGVGLGAGMVDNKSASITEVYQGLQFVYRVKDRPGL